MSQESSQGQTSRSLAANGTFFRDRMASYRKSIEELEIYANIHASLSDAISGSGRLVDIGNGGSCDYDTRLVREITAIDLFFDEILPGHPPPANVTLKKGSALDLPEPDQSYDCAVMAMLIHHLVGTNVDECLKNVRRALREAHRVLRPGGKIVVAESCVGPFFYQFERLVFPLVSPVINALIEHPATIQYTPQMLRAEIENVFEGPVEMKEIPRGQWLLHYGFKFPCALSPARPFQFCASRR